MPRVSVIIVNWNGKDLLEDCFAALRQQTFRDFEVVVVDNGSRDGSVELLKAQPDVRLVPLPENRGFAGGNIAGLAAASPTELVALLNNDTIVAPCWLADLVAALDADPAAGTAASKLVYHDDAGLIDSAGDGCVTSGHGVKIGSRKPAAEFNEPRYVFGACAGAVLYRRAMLDQVGFLDEDFFFNCEDTDLNFRAQLAGWKCVFVPTAVIRHRVSISVKKTGGLAVYYSSRNDEFVYFKNMPAILMLRFLHHKLIQELGTFVHFGIKRGQWRPWIRGKWDALRALPALLRKRRAIQRARKVDSRYIRGMLISILDRRLVREKLGRLFAPPEEPPEGLAAKTGG
jgi:GT2 family glycosyltransferase